MKNKVFISYSHDDVAYFKDLCKQLSLLSFTSLYSDLAEGDFFITHVQPRQNKKSETFMAIITCIAKGFLDIPWERIAIVSKLASSNRRWLGRFNSRGQAVFDELPEGNYSLRAVSPDMTARFGIEQEQPQSLAAAPLGSKSRETFTRILSGGKIIATIVCDTNIITIAFESEDPEFTDREISFSLFDANGNFIHQDRVKLEKVADLNVCEGAWQSDLDLPNEFELVIDKPDCNEDGE